LTKINFQKHFLFFLDGLAKVKLVTKEEAKSPVRTGILEALIKKMHKCKILTDAYQKEQSAEYLESPDFKRKCKEANNELTPNFGLPIYIFEKLDRDLWTMK
jgi:hypothetical protein